MPRSRALTSSSLSSSSRSASASAAEMRASSSSTTTSFCCSSGRVSTITPASRASASSRRSHPAKRISLSCEASTEGQNEKRRPEAPGRVRASVTKRKTSSRPTVSQVGRSISPSLRPPTPPDFGSRQPVRITVYVRPDASRLAVKAAASLRVGEGPSAVVRTKTRETPTALATSSCAGSSASLTLIASQTVAPDKASENSCSENLSRSIRPE
mmetsp:Transcript_47928/g.102386  ORF Transcript_47928/g.102386 Transcript_47928/m.102386 type:complete len:213 (-) Transcript_47928:313-951(-)